jgi:type I restriction enzyme S subunit
MAGEWREVALENVAVDVTVGHVGPMASEYSALGIPFLRSQNVDPFRINDTDLKFISKEFHDSLKKSALSPGDVVIVRTGKPGACAMIPQTLPVANCSDLVIVRCGAELDSRFLAYYVNSVAVHHVNSHLVGAVQQHFNVGSARKMLMRLPDLSEQRAIVNILGTLDDKIELNRRTSETLEAMARALFKSWFVDFDPVRAKAEGRDPGLPKPLADLFPARLVDSELGEIPEGWGVERLPMLIEVNPPRSLRKGEIAPYLDMANMPTRGHAPDQVTDRPFSSGMRFINGDTLVARITPCLENGKTACVDFLQDGQVGWGSTEYIVLRPKPPLPDEFAYCLARSDGFREFAIQSMTGSSGRQRVPVESLAHFQVPVTPRAVAAAFGDLIKPQFARAGTSVRESRALAALRDALLPKLISGELRVKDAEKLAERAAT